MGVPRALSSFQQANYFHGSSAGRPDYGMAAVYSKRNGKIFLFLNSSDQKFSFKTASSAKPHGVNL